MSRRLPPPNWLRAFEAAARHLSFTGAAQELHVTQPAVSQQVKLLENYLGQPLFHRLPRRLVLTEAGKVYVTVVHEAFERLASGTRELFGGDVARIVTIKVNVAFAALWLAPRLVSFKAEHPEIILRVASSIWLDETGWDGVDLEIRPGAGRWSGLHVLRLTRDELFPVCAPSMLAPDGPLAAPADVQSQTLISSLGNREGWDKWLALAGVPQAGRHGDLQVDTAVVAYQLAATGGGVALGRSSIVAGLLESGDLVRPFDLSLESSENFYLVFPERSQEHPAAVALRQWLVDRTVDARGPQPMEEVP